MNHPRKKSLKSSSSCGPHSVRDKTHFNLMPERMWSGDGTYYVNSGHRDEKFIFSKIIFQFNYFHSNDVGSCFCFLIQTKRHNSLLKNDTNVMLSTRRTRKIDLMQIGWLSQIKKLVQTFILHPFRKDFGSEHHWEKHFFSFAASYVFHDDNLRNLYKVRG